MHFHALRIQLFGGLRVTIGDRELTELTRWKRPATLLELLALAPGHALHREQAQDVLWSELDAQAAANNLHGALHQLRHLLEPDLLRGSHSSYLGLQSNVLRLHSAGSLWIDVEAFDLAASIARRTGETEAYETALAVYAGDLLPHTMYVDPIDRQRDVLRSRFLLLLRELSDRYLAAERRADATRTLERLVAYEPADEDACVHLMRLYAQRGQRQQALRQYQALQRALQHELDCEPDARVEQVRRDILHSYPARDFDSTFGRERLTGREQQITDLLVHGLSNRGIAERLGMSVRTAETHVSRILRKLDVGSRDQVPG